jgi:putative membrane protein
MFDKKELVVVMYGYGMGLSWIWPLLLLVGIAALAWGVIRATSSTRAVQPSSTGRACEILQERFARGEITEQELRERTRILDDH